MSKSSIISMNLFNLFPFLFLRKINSLKITPILLSSCSVLPGLFEIILVIKKSAQSDCKTYLLLQINILIGHRLIYKILLQNDKHLLVGHCSLVSQALSLNNSFLFVSQLNLVGKTLSRNNKIPNAWPI